MLNKNTHLISWLESSGMKQSSLAAAIGVGRSYICEVVAGKRRLNNLDLAFKIERVSGGAVPASSWVSEAGDGRSI